MQNELKKSQSFIPYPEIKYKKLCEQCRIRAQVTFTLLHSPETKIIVVYFMSTVSAGIPKVQGWPHFACDGQKNGH